MPGRKAARLLVGLSAAIAVLGMAVSAEAQDNQAKKIKIGVIYDLTGPLAGGGSELQYIGAKIMLDQYAKTGVEGYKVEAVYADAQSKPDVAINEAIRLIDRFLVDAVEAVRDVVTRRDDVVAALVLEVGTHARPRDRRDTPYQR
jgi:branched-chain amino acid transport system substrate-binding protein